MAPSLGRLRAVLNLKHESKIRRFVLFNWLPFKKSARSGSTVNTGSGNERLGVSRDDLNRAVVIGYAQAFQDISTAKVTPGGNDKASRLTSNSPLNVAHDNVYARVSIPGIYD